MTSSGLLQTPAALGPHTQKTNTEDASGSGARETRENTSGTIFLTTHSAREDRPCLGGCIVKDSGYYGLDWISWRSSLPSWPCRSPQSLPPSRYAPSPTRARRRGHAQAPQTSSVSPTVCICGASPSTCHRFHTAFPATSGGDGIYYINNRTDPHASAGQTVGRAGRPGGGSAACRATWKGT